MWELKGYEKKPYITYRPLPMCSGPGQETWDGRKARPGLAKLYSDSIFFPASFILSWFCLIFRKPLSKDKVSQWSPPCSCQLREQCVVVKIDRVN